MPLKRFCSAASFQRKLFLCYPDG